VPQLKTCHRVGRLSGQAGNSRELTEIDSESSGRSAAACVVARPRGDLERQPPTPYPLAEDNLINQKLAVHLLQKHGHSVVVASTGSEAVEAFRRETFDLSWTAMSHFNVHMST